MASLVHVLQSYHSGSLSREKLVDAVDQILAGERVNETWLLKTLKEENTRVPLPADVHAEVRGRIEQAAEQKQQRNNAAGAPAPPGDGDPDASRTRLATSLFGDDRPPSGPAGAGSWSPDSAETAVGIPGQFDREVIKGTGDVLNDRFVLEECVGAGGMSTVYKALDRRKLEADDRNPYVAVKVLNLEFRAHPDSLIALQREAKKSQSLAHTNIVRVYDFDRDGSTVYMTMEYLAGKSLAKILRAPDFTGLDEAEAMHILEQVAHALIFAHDNCIVHSDLKPANIILSGNGKVKVIDFGIARAFRRPDESDVEATRFDPGSLGALTPTYASPEMLEHREPDPSDDVYALACITYEMLTGRHPYGRVQANEARDGGLELKRRDLSRRQWRALKAALAFDREQRTPTVREFLAAIEPKRPVPASAQARLAAAAAVVATLGLSAYFLFDAGMLDYQQSRLKSASLPDNDSGVQSVELASLQADRVSVDDAAADTAAAPGAAGQAAVVSESTGAAPPADALAPESPLTTAALDATAPAVPAAATASGAALQTRVDRVLDELSCAAVNASVSSGGAVSLRGYVSNRLNIAALEKDLRALSGTTSVSTSLKPVDQGKCAAIEVFAPYLAIHREAGSGASISVRGKDNRLVEGDALVLDITTPARKTWVNVDYFSLDGGVVHLVPGPRVSDNQAPPNYRATIGDLGEWTISKPFGTEMVSLILTPRPLFGAARDEYEKHSDYLAAVRRELDAIARESGKDSVAVDLVMIDTQPRPLLKRILSGS